ncbi:pyridoxal phosphate-dependent transferase, partial [Crucibulum laeve]
KVLYQPLAETDPEAQNIIDELIASEKPTAPILTNKYSECLPNAHYYSGKEFIDKLEVLCCRRALEAFNLDPANDFAVLIALIQPSDRLMVLGLPDEKMAASSVYFQSLPYAIDPTSNLIDYKPLAAQVKFFKPSLIICGASAHPCDWDYTEPKKTAEKEGAWLMADIAHTNGLIAAQELNSSFEYCDVVSTTTHRALRGPRAGLIFFRKDFENTKDLEKRVNDAVFPACQGGPHNNTIAAVAQPEFHEYAWQVISNAQTFGASLSEHGYKLQTGGTDNHLVLWDLRPIGLTGSKVEKVCDLMGITINKNAVSGDASAQVPGGIRLGTSALTSRDMKEEDIKIVADFLHRTVQLSLLLQKEAGSKLLKDFVRVATTQEEGKEGFKQVKQLRDEVRTFASKWPLPGVDVSTL